MAKITGNDLREIRKKHRLKRSELADYLGVSPVTVEKWEQHGGNPIRAKYIDKISALSGIGAVGIGVSALAAPALLPFAALLGGGAAIGSYFSDDQISKAGKLIDGLKKLSEKDRKNLFTILKKMKVN